VGGRKTGIARVDKASKKPQLGSVCNYVKVSSAADGFELSVEGGLKEYS